MLKHFKYSKGLHILILFCFLLPFFNTSCGESKETLEKRENELAEKIAKGDTVVACDTVALGDTITPDVNYDSVAVTMAKELEAGTNKEPEKDDELLSHRILDKAPVLKPVLNPSEDIYSGIATILDSFAFIRLFMTPIAFLLLIISLTTKIMEKNAGRTIVLLEFLAFVFLLFAQSLSFDCERLWGVWVTTCLTGAMAIYDVYINRLFRKGQN